MTVVNERVRVASFNVRTCPDGEEGLWKLSGLTSELEQLGISLAGLQELRRTGSGEASLPAVSSNGSWFLLWSGHKQQHLHGVGLLLSRSWEQALLSYEAINERLLVARFAGNRKQFITVIVAYSPTDATTTTAAAQAEAFHDELRIQCTRANDRKDIVLVLGDFNAAVGKDSGNECIGLEQPPSQPDTASPNGIRLLTTAAIANLRVTNTFFKHKPIHQYTHSYAWGGASHPPPQVGNTQAAAQCQRTTSLSQLDTWHL